MGRASQMWCRNFVVVLYSCVWTCLRLAFLSGSRLPAHLGQRAPRTEARERVVGPEGGS